jgi:hypothetical protein
MAIYGVVMGQGVSVDDLTNHTLITGSGHHEDRVQSCSAVILVNSGDRAAGLFHFPAGNINRDYDSQNVLMEMIITLNPTEIIVAYGLATFVGVVTRDEPVRNEHFTAMEDTARLTSFLRKEASEAVIRSIPAHTGVIRIYYNGGQPTVGTGEIDNVTDLRAQQAGVHNGYTLYGEDRT